MAKPGKAHINLTTPGEYEYLASIRFEHDQSECLRLTEIRLKDKTSPKPYKLPQNLLTWFTEHAPAGREITRDDNNQNNQANLYIELASLREQIETFSLKSPFNIEIYLNELDRNDEILARADNGMIELEVNLYDGPKAKCNISLDSLQFAPGITLIYPENASSQGRFDLASVVVKADEGPLDPRTDKRVAICNVELEAPFIELRHDFIKYLTLYQGSALQPHNYVQDGHHYEDLYKSHPSDQKSSFPNGAKLFGPLLPQGPKEKDKPYTIALNAPINAPFWQALREAQLAAGKPIKGTLYLILPEPDKNQVKSLPFTIVMDANPWLLITDITALSAPVLIPLSSEQPTKELTLSLPAPHLGAPESEFLYIEYYAGLKSTEGSKEGHLLNIALNPQKKETAAYTFRPEVVEITENERQYVLLNPVPAAKKQKLKQSIFKLKCFWPDQEKTINHTLIINWEKPNTGSGFAVDFGAASITLVRKNGITIDPVALGSGAPQSYLSDFCLPSTVTLSSRKTEYEATGSSFDDQNWHAKSYPLSISYEVMPWHDEALQTRLNKSQRHYDIALPGKPPEQVSEQLSEQEADQDAPQTNNRITNLKRTFIHDKINLAPTKEQYYIARQTTDVSHEKPEVGLVKNINPTNLMADCLSELIDFYGTYLPRINAKEPITVEEKNAAAKALDSTTLVLTYPDYLNFSGQNRYKAAAATALNTYELGSFVSLGAIAQLLSMPSKQETEQNIHLVPETAAGAYYCLNALALRDQPARGKKVQQIHMDIGTKTASISAFSGWIGETKTLLEHQYATINLPLGGATLELMLAKEIANILETALSSGAPITAEAPPPLSLERIKAVATPQNEAEAIALRFMQSLRGAMKSLKFPEAPTQPSAKTSNDIKLVLAKSEGKNWPFSLATTIVIEQEPVNIWQGLRGEQIVLIPSKTKNQWRLELHCSTNMMCEKVGPLTTYLSFLTQLLPRVISNCFPDTSSTPERFISLVGGTSLFPALQNHLAETSKKLHARQITPPTTYDEAKLPVAHGALSMITHQARSPSRLITPSLVLVAQASQSNEANTQDNLVALANSGAISIIASNKAEGPIPQECSSLQLFETIPGLGELLQKDPKALSCRTYMDDLDHANASQWAKAEAQWQIWLGQCYQTMLNMAVSQNEVEESKGSSLPTSLEWRFKALQENQAELSIGDHTYWISSGLTAPE